MNGNIYIKVQPRRYPSDDDYSFTIPLDEVWIREADVSLDEPMAGDKLSPLICDLKRSPQSRMEIRTIRKHHAKKLEGVIIENIIKFFERNDTINGYKR